MIFFRRRLIEDETESLQRDIEHLKTKMGKENLFFQNIINQLVSNLEVSEWVSVSVSQSLNDLRQVDMSVS